MARKMKNCENAATAADSAKFMLLIPATAPPPRALKNVTALVIVASMSAFFPIEYLFGSVCYCIRTVDDKALYC
jgi:hypothetical protein